MGFFSNLKDKFSAITRFGGNKSNKSSVELQYDKAMNRVMEIAVSYDLTGKYKLLKFLKEQQILDLMIRVTNSLVWMH